MKHPTTSFEISLKDLQNYTQNRLFYQSLLICFLVPEKRIIFAKVQRRKRGKIRLSYHLSFKLLVVNWSNMLHRKITRTTYILLCKLDINLHWLNHNTPRQIKRISRIDENLL